MNNEYGLPAELASAASVAGLSDRNWDADDVRAFQEFLDMRGRAMQQSVPPVAAAPAVTTVQPFNEYISLGLEGSTTTESTPQIHSSPPMGSTSTMSRDDLQTQSKEQESADKKKFRRSRKGCYTCRARKIKCDEGRPVCHRCQVAKRECKFPPSIDYNNDNNRRGTGNLDDEDSNGDRPGWLKYTTDPPDFLAPFLPDSSSNPTAPRITNDSEASQVSQIGPRFPAPTFLDVDGNIGPALSNAFPPPQPDVSLSQNMASFTRDFEMLSQGSETPAHKRQRKSEDKSVDNDDTSMQPSTPSPFDALYPPSPFAIPFETKFPTSSNPPDISKLREDERADPPRTTAFQIDEGEGEDDDTLHKQLTKNMESSTSKTSSVETSSPLLSNPDYLFPFFPAPQDRMLVHHYLTQSVRFIIALNLPHSVNPWIRIHAPLAFGMIADKNPNEAYAQAQVTGQGISVEALRTGLLSVSAVHLAYLRGKDPASRDLAASLRRTAVRYLQKAVSAGEVETDTFLAGVLSVAMRDILAGDPGWKGDYCVITISISLTILLGILELAKSVIQKRGGPIKMLETGKPSKKKEVSVPRFLLEQLATRDVFGSLTTGEEPAIIKGWSPWFLELGETGSCDWEWESVERMFGLSRGMVDLIARISSLVARKRKLGLPLYENDAQKAERCGCNSGDSTPEMRGRSELRSNRKVRSSGSDSRSRTRVSRQSRSSNSRTRSRSARRNTDNNDVIKEMRRQALQEEARETLAELENFSNQMNFIQLHPRVSVGNHAHRYAMQIHILRNLFEVSTNDERVVRATESILEVCFEGSSTGMVVWLTWPVLIAGMHSTSYEQRASVLALLQSFKTQACWDVESAEAILKEYWRRYDLGHNTLSWMDVMRDMNLDVLLV
ncbi:hypothetical protein E3Q06_00326 [Wallemia mellicola]|uniref:Zn(2)-C6 fungal-type domain-containing protein n=1 Tax=Wallemia mellicola TaxID=1708541 RepID=A0AB38N0D5_9BASI|nr:hypothetical protein E3Q21_03464 [Wallemia mellicola]TIB85106.1 hypothetical protein E3Q20_03419 [Wallemia mellicola]TIC21050.1 hypothetical protein E3Q13_00266 [Wallemia mellicola]TIC44044.1 hypothetical protein E3Q07_00326 [Wallemia mellicola]TIC53234.1 hypothetical protein E3Q06_00326 [Wallemia mellicola]